MTSSNSRCSRWKMMGRGAEGGCGTEEKPCTISRVSRRHPVTPSDVEIDFYSQAQKVLCERSPFEDETEISRVSNLPQGLVDFLSKCSHSRKRHKKSHSESGAKSSGHASVSQPRVSNIWSKTEDYFRQVAIPDIGNLLNQSSFTCSTSQSCFSIPSLPKVVVENVDSVATVSSTNGIVEVSKEVEMKEDEENLMEIDDKGAEILPKEETEPLITPSSPSSSTGLEWLLGARNKILLTSERPSKKRKLLGSDAGLDRLIVVCPSEGQNLPVCHLCCLGDTSEQLNKFLVCDSCKVAVHQKCYGVQDVPVGLWLCSWCKLRGSSGTGTDGSELSARPCFLCSKPGGALKPVGKDGAESKNGGFVKFAHLFCSQWMPEVYVEDTKKMEPIMNIEGIKETRRKLVCYLCKVKYGACVRCSHGTCRTAFHPICAREANHRMEIWGKFGCENVELRAFCSKHSEFQDVSSNPQSGNHLSVVSDCGSSISKHSPMTLVVSKPQKLKLGRKNDQKNMVRAPTTDANSDKVGNSEVPSRQDTPATRSNTRLRSECSDGHLLVSMETPEMGKSGDTNPSDSLDIVQALKKLVDRGKAIMSDVASEMGISSDTLAATLAGDQPSFFPDLRCKIIKWLRSHAYMVAGSENSEDVPFKSVPPRRRTKSNIRILKDNKVLCSSDEKLVLQNGNGIVIDEADVNPLVPNGDVRDDDSLNKSISRNGDSCIEDKDVREKILAETSGEHGLDPSLGQSTRPEAELVHPNMSGNDQEEEVNISLQSTLVNSDGEYHVSSVDAGTSVVPDLISGKSASCSYVHPFIHKKLMQNSTYLKQEHTVPEIYDPREKVMVLTEPKNGCDNLDGNPTCIDTDHSSDGIGLKKLDKARKMGVMELSPEDEVEGQLIYFQNKLLDHTIASKRHCDELVFRVVKSLPQELDAASKQRWDLVLVNQYLCGIREAKKQGRKEKRHKEAQAVLAAATAAAAASSRISSFRKDAHDEAHHESQLKMNAVSGRTAPYSQLMPRAKETLSRLAVGRISSEKHSDIFQLNSGFSKEHPQSCEICRRSETLSNPILVCCNCKVAVHLGCYRSVKDPSGPWYCELCEELLASRSPRVPVVTREKPCFVAQCSLCGGTTGAFRWSTDGQWVHAFCAEWLLESTFSRGQQNPVEGLETISWEKEVCCICCRKLGVCIKCNYGNCQSTFHPSCARNAGLYMHVKTSGSKLQHKAYCEKHSLEQREKAETQQHGVEELKSIKQIRVELERVRLLCERIIKREKVKRELVLCSHDILASKRDSVALSVLVRSPFFLPDVSSESATTSLRGHVDDNKSCNEAVQRSDDITVDTAVSGKRRIMLPAPMDIDQKTDDSSTSQGQCTKKTIDRMLFSGKKLPHRPASVASRNLADDGEKRSKSRKHTETFQKELVMTSDQASVQNQRLPKGFAYVPVVCLPKEKPPTLETGSEEPVEPDG
ncbi:zinc finger protein [Macleaya cordata]|uniref:Zinc finger protein n=1 Tax=Macleaya cordata TaxID=56857 RepID=A0A200Q2S6_MACCD|nr:zinc finger protein [Macleaya cordata]